jgi:hypothetical protein
MFGLTPDSTDANDRIEWPTANRFHAIGVSEFASIGIGVTAVRPFVDKCAHSPHFHSQLSCFHQVQL